MSKIEKFKKWAMQFIAIQDSHVREFLDSIGDMNLYEMKCKFSEKYQQEISFSYSIQVERKDKVGNDKIAFYRVLQEENFVRDLHIKKIDDKTSNVSTVQDNPNDPRVQEILGEGNGYGIAYGNSDYMDDVDFGGGYGDEGYGYSNEYFGEENDACSGDGCGNGDGRGYGNISGYGCGIGFGWKNCYGDAHNDGCAGGYRYYSPIGGGSGGAILESD